MLFFPLNKVILFALLVSLLIGHRIFIIRFGEQLHTSLMKSVAEGSYDKLVYNHPVIKESLSKSALAERLVHRLANPDMIPETPTKDSRR